MLVVVLVSVVVNSWFCGPHLVPCSDLTDLIFCYFLSACSAVPPSIQAVVIAGKEKGPPLKLDLDITSEDLEKRLKECLASRGRKATDPKVSTRYSMLSSVPHPLLNN